MAATDGQQTPSLEQIVKDGIEATVANLHVALPAEVVSYDAAKQRCSVQPLIRRKYEDGSVVNLPIITNVPVAFPRAGNAFISLPLQKGNSVLLVFSERSLDRWLSQGGVTTADDPRKHDLSDAVAIPGVYPFNNPCEASTDSIRIQYGDARIDVMSDGKFKFENTNEGKELITVMRDFINACLAARTNTALGPQPLVPPSLFTSVRDDLDKLKGA